MIKIINKNPPYKNLKIKNLFYKKLFQEELKNMNTIENFIVYGVRYLGTIEIKNMDLESLNKTLELFEKVERKMKNLTTYEFIKLFPIINDYDIKISEENLSKNISTYDFSLFLWDYQNKDIINFTIKKKFILEKVNNLKNSKGL